MKKSVVKILIVFLVMFTILPFGITVLGDDEDGFIDTADFAGKRIGTVASSVYTEDYVLKYIDNPELYFYNSYTDALMALQNGKIDAIIGDEPNCRYIASQVQGIESGKIKSETTYIAEVTAKSEKGKVLADQISELIIGLKESGELEIIQDIWFSDKKEEQYIEDYTKLPDTNGTIVIATDATLAPFTYVENGKYAGFEIDLMVRFCKEYGYRPDFRNVAFSGIIAGITSGTYDVGASNLTVTEERKEVINFPEPACECYVGLMYREGFSTGSTTSIANSFKNTFIEDNRWLLFVEGCLVTLEITILSIVFGTLLGFFVHTLCRRGNKIANGITRFFEWLINGMPVVVLLMIMFYIILGRTAIGGVAVAIICFTLTFGASMHAMLKSGEKAIDPGQALAAKALGYTSGQTFRHILFPQAVKHILPSYISEISTHIKATAVVGYIAVVDLTKVGDIIRGITYEPFFPLIAVAILYFVLAGILKTIAKVCTKGLDPTRRKEEKILKGAKIK